MADLFAVELKFISVEDFKESSTSDLASQSDEVITKYISLAENTICERYTVPEVIPEVIPDAFKQSTVLVAECLYNKDSESSKTLVEEKDENHTRKYQVISTEVWKNCLAWLVSTILKDYKDPAKALNSFYRT